VPTPTGRSPATYPWSPARWPEMARDIAGPWPSVKVARAPRPAAPPGVCRRRPADTTECAAVTPTTLARPRRSGRARTWSARPYRQFATAHANTRAGSPLAGAALVDPGQTKIDCPETGAHTSRKIAPSPSRKGVKGYVDAYRRRQPYADRFAAPQLSRTKRRRG
jgi:hypothetical protein